METVLYELHFHWEDLPVMLIPLLVGIGFWLVSCRMAHAASAVASDLNSPVRRDLSASPAVKWFLRGIAILSCTIFLFSGTMYLINFLDLKSRYQAGDYLTAEGYVEDLTMAKYPEKGGDSFTLDGVAFAYSDTDLSLYGYRKEAQYGGAITEEGQYLIIRYLPDSDTGMNHILYIVEKNNP